MEQILNLPRHVLIIPDGNRRWAEKHNKARSEGHLEGARKFREISRVAFEAGIKYFTFWAASATNLRERGAAEVQVLFSLFRHELEKKNTLENCLRNKINFRVLGAWHAIRHDSHLLHLIRFFREQTRMFDQHFLTILFGYSGTDEGEEAARRLYKHHPRHSSDGKILKRIVWTHDLPEVDLIIRTGIERPNWTHNSDGILNPWLSPNSQIYSPPQILWPDFTAEMFRETVEIFSKITRRFGA